MTTEIIDIPIENLLLDENVRKHVHLDPEFLGTIKALGVLELIEVFPADEHGNHTVFDGQRRTLAAAELGLTSLQARVLDNDTIANRIKKQVVVNNRRAPLTDADLTGAFLQLDGLGVSTATIAKTTGTTKERVASALVVAKNPASAAAITTHQLTIDQALAFSDFDDEPETLEQLATVATDQPDQFAHAVARAHTARTRRLAMQKLADELEARGVIILDSTPDYYDAVSQTLNQLRKTADGPRGITEEDVPAGHLAATISYRWNWQSNSEIAEANYYVTNYTEAGFHGAVDTSSSKPEGGGLTEEEKEKRAISRANTKLWAPATAVRIAFIKDLLQRKEEPAGWQLAVAQWIASGMQIDYRTRDTIPALLDITGKEDKKWLAEHPNRAWAYALAASLGVVEGSSEFDRKGWSFPSMAVPHLKQLSKWGYVLSDIEEAIANGKTSVEA